MEMSVYFTFVVATTLMLALPGPSVLMTVAHSISFGWRHSLFTVGGATVGIAVQLIIATIGLVSLLNVVADVFDWLRWAGAAYLIYLGIKQWQRANEPLETNASSVSKAGLFIQGVAVTIPNPKSLIFIAAFLPQFIDTERSLGMQFVCIIPTFLVITFIVTGAWGVAAGKASIFLRSQKAIRNVLRTAGGLMVAAGVGLALARRSN